MAWL